MQLHMYINLCVTKTNLTRRCYIDGSMYRMAYFSTQHKIKQPYTHLRLTIQNGDFGGSSQYFADYFATQCVQGKVFIVKI